MIWPVPTPPCRAALQVRAHLPVFKALASFSLDGDQVILLFSDEEGRSVSTRIRRRRRVTHELTPTDGCRTERHKKRREALKKALTPTRSAVDMDPRDGQPFRYQRHWPVNALHDHRKTPTGYEFLTEWGKSWVHADDLDGAEELVDEYWLSLERGDQARRRAASEVVSLTCMKAKVNYRRPCCHGLRIACWTFFRPVLGRS
jgi:hypothetical protein